MHSIAVSSNIGNMLDNSKEIAVVGGGPGGLTLARLLQIKGADVKVYERDLNKEVRVQGATLDLHGDSGLAALEKAGLMDAFKANYRPGAEKMRITDFNATVFYDEHTEGGEDKFGGQFYRPEIDRGPLRNMLLESLQPGTVVWDSQFVSMEKKGKGWQLYFKNKTSAYAEIVIGADGANSGIRSYITPIKPFYSGISVIEGSVYDCQQAVPEIHELLKGGKIFAFGGGKNLIVSSKGDGSLNFYASCKTDENWVKNGVVDFSDKAQVTAWFKKEFRKWAPIWLSLFENASLPFIPRTLYCMPLDQTWETIPNLTLLGDAAHLMPPFAGEGVNMAMLDALELSEYLDFNDIPASIAVYERNMQKRGAEAAQTSLENSKWMHSKDALSLMLDMFKQPG
jgi:2-polyprenyl-6-methoxyphenol hydroxylase-like FAD-dependent oxidoreductase